MSPPPRLTDLPLPPYTFVPGKRPHPHSDPAGHRLHPPPATLPTADTWRKCQAYLYGIDLFNHGCYWEAHEAWEAVWSAVGRHGQVADFLKALIQLAVAGVKHFEGIPQGVTKHARRAGELCRDVAAGADVFFGLRLDALIALAEAVQQRGWPGESPMLALDEPG
ncbi:hypothetical protein AYO44_00450 [Planctomycetaceae bacterium SCGC AG-212-F19]|nr:hypothetical protein AYO44_00450 [Planctomycetaceae bacterium SCGC AG-212-F19]